MPGGWFLSEWRRVDCTERVGRGGNDPLNGGVVFLAESIQVD